MYLKYIVHSYATCGKLVHMKLNFSHFLKIYYGYKSWLLLILMFAIAVHHLHLNSGALHFGHG